MEDLRETYGLRTSDKRMNQTLIHLTYPSFEFEEGFTEEDELWIPGERESDEHREARTKRALGRILRSEDTCKLWQGRPCSEQKGRRQLRYLST